MSLLGAPLRRSLRLPPPVELPAAPTLSLHGLSLAKWFSTPPDYELVFAVHAVSGSGDVMKVVHWSPPILPDPLAHEVLHWHTELSFTLQVREAPLHAVTRRCTLQVREAPLHAVTRCRSKGPRGVRRACDHHRAA